MSEFNLSEERKFMRFEMMLKENRAMALLLDIVERQDKEFIRRLKESNENNFLYGKYAGIMNENIDKLAGDKLI